MEANFTEYADHAAVLVWFNGNEDFERHSEAVVMLKT
jgi:hypothetical protein